MTDDHYEKHWVIEIEEPGSGASKEDWKKFLESLGEMKPTYQVEKLIEDTKKVIARMERDEQKDVGK